MPRKTKTYNRVIFSPVVLSKAESIIGALTNASFGKILPDKDSYTIGCRGKISNTEDETLTYDTEQEFFADYRKGFYYANFEVVYTSRKTSLPVGSLDVSVFGVKYIYPKTTIEIFLDNRSGVEQVFSVFEEVVKDSYLPQIPPKLFIGHGQNPAWKDLKDHLHEKHGYDIIAYEIGARAGFTIQEVLKDMLSISSLALIVLTGEDEDSQGKIHARENVIHELGLFQGHLGWQKAIVLLEEGVEEFSNIKGINQIRFSKGHIQVTFGDVLATIKREFP